MNRRRFIVSTGAIGTATLAGCLGSSTPPPRESEVFEDLAVTGSKLQVTIEDQPVIQSRADVTGPTATPSSMDAGGLLASLSPIGVAAAKGGGKGATGRGLGKASTAPKGWGGHAKYHGDDYDDWREDHEGEVRTYEAEVTQVAIGYIGTGAQMRENAPPPGPIDWDKTWLDPEPGQTLEYSFDREGWYRSGTKLEAREDDHSFGWECVDFEVEQTSDGARIGDSWKVSPRL